MLNSNLFKAAHKMAKDIKSEYAEVNYKFQFGLCLSYLSKIEGEIKMVELKGSEKQIKWAEEIRKEMLQGLKIINAIKIVWAKSMNEPVLIAILKDMENVKTKIEDEVSANWFIDNRHTLTHYSTSNYKEDVVILRMKYFVETLILEDLINDEVEKVYFDMFYTAR